MSLIQGHSYFFHGAMMAIAVYMITSKIYKFDKKEFYNMFIFLAIYTAFAAILSIFIGEDISLFGPDSSYLGFLFNTFGYFVGVLILHILFYLICIGLFSLIGLFTKKRRKRMWHNMFDIIGLFLIIVFAPIIINGMKYYKISVNKSLKILAYILLGFELFRFFYTAQFYENAYMPADKVTFTLLLFVCLLVLHI